ncbi:MAG: glycosyltransferase family 4 protein [Verrucomicrobiota bacterium]|nr:glycosyltransferase family 4 protein [Verrucomicrobiota bacterium]
MILLSHPTGNENVRQVARAFADAGLLDEFWTSLSWNPDSTMAKFLPARMQALLGRRSFPGNVRARVHSRPWRELARLLLPSNSALMRHETGPLSIDAVLREHDRAVSRRLREHAVDAVYAYEDGACATFAAAKAQGVPTIYDLPIGYYRVAQGIFAEERERLPEWAATLTGARDSGAKLARKEEELRLADCVLVASTFTAHTLAQASQLPRIEIIPYGAPEPSTEEIPEPRGKLRLLFAGSLGQRKGLADALRAVEIFGESRCELTLLGRKVGGACRPLDDALRRHRWLPSLPHAEVLQTMRESDAVLFPSLFEGFGLVITEAMSQGTPVITTAHTAGPDLISDGVDGFLVPIRAPEAIAAKLEEIDADRARLREIKVAARGKTATCTWQKYRERVVAVAREVMNNQAAR